MSETILMILAAVVSIASSNVPPTNVAVGPFKITSMTGESQRTFYPEAWKITTLAWKSADQLLSYRLYDDGQSVSISIELVAGRNLCGFNSEPLDLTKQPDLMFDRKSLVHDNCAKLLPPSTIRSFDNEISAAKVFFPDAYAMFLVETRKLHGASDVRCLEFMHGNHGPVCVRHSNGVKSDGR